MKHPSFLRRKRLGSLAGCLTITGGLLLCPTSALGDEPRRAAEPHILADSAAELTQVVDAFDEFNDFDVHMSLSFRQSTRSATIYRESGGSLSGLGGGSTSVAEYVESTNRLIPAVQIGLFRDVALSVRLPIILSNERRLEDGSSSAGPFPGAAGAPPGLVGLGGEQLFSVPFAAPTRSGIEYLAVGLDFGITNQYRKPALPTWVVGLEGRFNVTEPMRACNASPGATTTPAGQPAQQVGCAYPSDVNRDGVSDPRLDPDLGRSIEGRFAGSRRAGVSRGTTALEAHTYVSKRIKYLEPYAGLSGLMEIPTSNSDFAASNLQAATVNHPPLRGTLVLGTVFVPWEVRENFQRIAFDTRIRGTYVSTGRDYSELFDALGSSSAASLRSPSFSHYRRNVGADGRVDNANPSVVDPNSERTYFTGLTNVQHHGEYELSGQFTWQAGEYVKFDIGAAWRIIQAHFITFDRQCGGISPAEPAEAGPCKQNVGTEDEATWASTGTPNPDYRGAINDPGNRYHVGTSHGLDAWVRASVMF